MIAEALRKSILQAAIQGKLSEQLPEDGDARELLEAIKTEKAQLIKEGKIKRENPLPEITEEEIPFDIPENWCWVRVGDVISVSSGKGLSQNNMDTQGEYPVYGGNGINGRHSEWFIPKDTLVIGRVGFYCGCVHKVISNCWVTDNALIVQVKKNIYNIDYLRLILKELDLKSTSVSTAQPVISGMRIYPQIIPVPPKIEQLRILEKLDKILPRIDDLEKDESKLDLIQKSFPKKMKDSLLQAAIQGKLTEQMESDGDARELVADIQKEKERLIKEGKIKKEKALPEIAEDEIPFEIPENWCWVRLGTIIYNHGQKCPENEFTYIDISSINNKANTLGALDNLLQPNEAPSRARKIVHKGDVIYATVRPYLHNICVIDREIKPEPIVSTGFAVVCTPMPILNQYLFRYFLSPAFDSYANDNDNSKGVAYPAINDDKFSKALVPLPPLSEQQRIVERLEQLLPLCDALE
jgi:type I restriction enzyme S subunit